MFSKVVILSALVTLATTQANYPLFNQCDSRWGTDPIGNSTRTICRAGGLISSVAMVLNACQRNIGG